MENLRRYGQAPFKAALIHGGPGAAGEMAPVAAFLAEEISVLEPLQTADSLDAQVSELRDILERESSGVPLVLAGYSWGAWLALILAARHPELVKKLILISSGPFEEKYSHAVTEARFARLTVSGRAQAGELIQQVEGPPGPDRAKAFALLGALLSKTDACDPEPEDTGPAASVTLDEDIFQKVWRDAALFRRDGRLLSAADQIKCPVTAIHGDYDPHPAAGVSEPLRAVIKNFKFILLRRCGHKPWIEKEAKNKFYGILKEEINYKG